MMQNTEHRTQNSQLSDPGKGWETAGHVLKGITFLPVALQGVVADFSGNHLNSLSEIKNSHIDSSSLGSLAVSLGIVFTPYILGSISHRIASARRKEEMSDLSNPLQSLSLSLKNTRMGFRSNAILGGSLALGLGADACNFATQHLNGDGLIYGAFALLYLLSFANNREDAEKATNLLHRTDRLRSEANN